MSPCLSNDSSIGEHTDTMLNLEQDLLQAQHTEADINTHLKYSGTLIDKQNSTFSLDVADRFSDTLRHNITPVQKTTGLVFSSA